MLKTITGRYGKERRTWIMDRCIPTEETLDQMRQTVPTTVTLKSGQSFVVKARYAPKSHEFSYLAAGIEFTYEEDYKTKRQQVSFRGF